MFKKIVSKIALLSLCTVSTLAVAEEFSVTWNGTLSAGSNAPYIPGEAISVTMVLDNGGTDAISQTWTSGDLVSVTYRINNSPITTVFGPGNLALTAGSFVTDAAGALTAVPSAWGNFTAPMPVISSDDPLGTSDIRWVINGINYVYRNNSSAPPPVDADAVNVAENISVAAWSDPIAVNPPVPPTPGAQSIPTMSAYGLVLTVLGLLVVAGRRLRRSGARF